MDNDVYSTYPLGLMYVAAMLKSRGHDVLIYHDDVSNPAPIPSRGVTLGSIAPQPLGQNLCLYLPQLLDGFQPDVVGISYCTIDVGSAHVVAHLVKQRGIRVVAGGIHPSLLPNEEIELFDAVVVGEGESEIAAQAFEDPDTTIVEVPLIENLDAFLPDRDCVIGKERYSSFLQGFVATQRGCPYSCSYCATPQVFGCRARTRDPELVRKEVESLEVCDGRIIDDSFGVRREHGLRICKELSETNYRWICDVALQNIDEERIAAFVQGGCRQINIGIESAVPKWQKLSGKHIEPSKPEAVCEMARNNGLEVVFYFMIGWPGETIEELRETIDYAKHLKELGAKPCISIVTPYPKTKLWAMAHQDEEGVRLPWSDFVHQSSKMGFADCSPEEWQEVLSEANEIG